MALTPAQQQVLRVFQTIDDTGGFALAGGGAMNLHEVVDRATNDLDLFTPQSEQVALMADCLGQALVAAGSTVTVLLEARGFVRLEVTSDDGGTLVELAHDARWLDPVQTELGLVLDLRELAADKLCALFGRAKSRDLYDVVRLSERLPLEQMVEWATKKDAGFDIGITKEMVVAIKPKLNGLDISRAEFDRIRTKLVVDLARLEAKQRRLGSAPAERSRDL